MTKRKSASGRTPTTQDRVRASAGVSPPGWSVMGAVRGAVVLRPSTWLVLAALALYTLTAPPDLTWRHGGMDGAELAIAAYHEALPHPSGYPAYTLIGHWLMRLSSAFPAVFPDPSRALTLLSAGCGALALAFLAESITHLLAVPPARSAPPRPPFRWIVALLLAALVGLAPVYWSQAIIIEVYAPMALLWAVLVWSVVTARAGWAAFLIGLSLTHHLVILWALPGILWLAARRGVRPRPLYGLYAALPLLIWLRLPAMASVEVLPWGEALRENGAIWFVSGRYYEVFQFRLDVIPARIAALVGSSAPFDWVALSVGLVGLLIGVVRQQWRDLALSAALTVIGVVGYSLSYGGPDTDAYLLPALMVWPLAALPALAALRDAASARWGERGARWAQGLLLTALLALVLWFAIRGYPAVSLNQDQEVSTWLAQTLVAVPDNSVLVTSSDGHTFSAWYLQAVCGWRRDVLIIDPALLPRSWFRSWFVRQVDEWRLDDLIDLEAVTLAARRDGRALFVAIPPGDPRAAQGALFDADQRKVIDTSASVRSSTDSMTTPSAAVAPSGVCNGRVPSGR